MQIIVDTLVLDKQKYIICDLDGTLADIEHRRHYVNDGNNYWDEFFAECDQDTVKKPVREILVRFAQHGVKIFLFSGRMETVRGKTEAWLKENAIPYNLLLMRPSKDNTPDDILKEQWLHNKFKNLAQILFVLDDRDKVVDMWRRNGLTCLQVAPGNF